MSTLTRVYIRDFAVITEELGLALFSRTVLRQDMGDHHQKYGTEQLHFQKLPN